MFLIAISDKDFDYYLELHKITYYFMLIYKLA